LTLIVKNFLLAVARPGKEVKKVEEIEGNQTEEKSKKQSEDHLGCSHYHIHFCGEKFSEIFSG